MMSKENLRKIKQEVKEKALAKMRLQWFKDYKKIKNISRVCQIHGISRTKFYYWEKRIDLNTIPTIPKTICISK